MNDLNLGPGGILFPALLIFLLPTVGLAQVLSSFDTDAQGWIIQDVDCYDGYSILYDTVPLVWQASGGDPGGHVTHYDFTNYCSFFSAPASYLGDKSEYLGGFLDFSLNSTESSWLEEDVVVLIGADLVACHELPLWPPEPPEWHHFLVHLDASAFTYDDENGGPVSETDFLSIMSDLEVMLLPAEFGAQVGETVGLDRVWIRLPGTPVPDAMIGIPRLHEACPNPFNPQTTIAFEFPTRETATLRVFDMAGRLVKGLITAEPHFPGRHEVVWNGRDDTGRQVASGTYFYRLEAGSYSETKRMVLVK